MGEGAVRARPAPPASPEAGAPAPAPEVAPSRKPNGHDPDRRLLEALYRAHVAELTAWLRQRYGPGPPAPEDIAQTAFERLAALSSLAHIRHPKSFLYRAAANAALDAIARVRRTRRFIDHEMQRRAADLEEITPERVSMAKERFDRLAEALDGLPAKQKEVVIRIRFLGQTLEEAAAETGWSKSDIFRQLKSALVAVQAALATIDEDAAVRDGARND